MELTSVMTNKDDFEKGFMKKNLENMVEFIQKHLKLNGFVITQQQSLSDIVKSVIDTGVKNGWIVKKDDSFYVE